MKKSLLVFRESKSCTLDPSLIRLSLLLFMWILSNSSIDAGEPGNPDKSRSPKTIEEVKSSVALIEGPLGHGSGFVIRPNVIATNAHVIRDNLMKDIKVNFISNTGQRSKELQPELLYEDKAKDLALLYVPGMTNREPLELARQFEPGRNKKVYIVGSPGQPVRGMSRVNAIAEGIADEIVSIDQQYFIQIKVSNSDEVIHAGPGNSGGPVVDPSGHVVGVTTLALMTQNKQTQKLRAGNALFCIPAHEIQAILDQLEPPSQWKERIEKATARHAMDISVVHLYLSAKVAELIFETRVELDQAGRTGMAQSYSAYRREGIARGTLQVDRMLIDAYREFDEQARTLISPALQQLNASSKLLSAETSKNLNGMRTTINQIRKTVMQASFSNFEYQQCCQSLKSCDACFQKLKTRTGLTDEILDNMVEHALNSVNAKLKKHGITSRK